MIRLILGIVLGALTVVFAVQNPQTVSYEFLAWTLSAPRALVLIIVLAAGVLIGWLLSALTRATRNRDSAEKARTQKPAS